MQKKVVIGKQDFESLRQNDYFYIDKTEFIREWWDSGDDVTLITRPRRFGKTLNMSMLNCFFQKNMQNMRNFLKILIFGNMKITGTSRENIRLYF